MNILLAHGSSDSVHGEQVRALAERASELLGEEVGAGFLSDERLPEGARVLPLFLGAGKHVTEDIPKLIEASNCILLPSLNEHAETLVDMAFDQLTQESKRINVLFALYRFSGFTSLTAAIHSKNKRCSKVAMASMHSEPSIESVLQLWQQNGIDAVTVQPMLLFGGRSLARVQSMIDKSPMTNIRLAPVLSEHEDFASFIADCLKQES
ncbi:MAG: CbiX/SirB N-terminal domain-containing protein [Mariprofundaceae bacterium]